MITKMCSRHHANDAHEFVDPVLEGLALDLLAEGELSVIVFGLIEFFLEFRAAKRRRRSAGSRRFRSRG